MTAAEQLIEEGLEKGLQKGRYEGRQQGIIDNLEIRFDSVPEGLQETIHGVTDDAKLRQLHIASMKCASVEDFAKSL